MSDDNKSFKLEQILLMQRTMKRLNGFFLSMEVYGKEDEMLYRNGVLILGLYNQDGKICNSKCKYFSHIDNVTPYVTEVIHLEFQHSFE